MKPITLHPVSVLIGLALAALVFLVTSAQTIATRDRIVGYVPAGQWTYIKIQSAGGAASYTVQSDRYLVVTRATGTITDLTVNGVNGSERFTAVGGQDVGNTRVVLQPGDVISALGGFTIQIWGYLEPL